MSMSPIFPVSRPQRLRRNKEMRALVSETRISPLDLVCPLFIRHGKDDRREIPSMPGQFQITVDHVSDVAKEIQSLGIPSIMLFGVPQCKDEVGSDTCSKDGVAVRAISAIKDACPDIVVISDLCLCDYTENGHCGVMSAAGTIDNDRTLAILQSAAVTHAQAGADMLAPSGNMDGMVKAIRSALDESSLTQVSIMSHSAKFASSFYGPFRDAAECGLKSGDRMQYQLDPSNAREALREIEIDIQEGADIVIVKPAMSYLDIIYASKQKYLVPVAAYQVSGEYSMICAAANNGWIDKRKAVLESITSIKRSGADIIITYFARDIARWIV